MQHIVRGGETGLQSLASLLKWSQSGPTARQWGETLGACQADHVSGDDSRQALIQEHCVAQAG